MLRFIVVVGIVVNAILWGGLVYRKSPNVADMSCPATVVRIRYPAAMADYHDGEGRMQHYRIAYCKPTGIDWRR